MENIFINILRVVTMAIFIALVPILFFSKFGTTLVWTILIPILPLALLVIGFSRWRDICPLAMISKISQRAQFIKKRKVPEWFEENFWNFQYFLLFLALSYRLTTLNYDNYALGVFFVFIIFSAFITNLFYTGKSWCNFFCPVGAVEKIYTISNAKNYMQNSACGTCTACKKNCPDIDLESNYWKEGANKQKSFVFYSFSGMILGFYLYFYLQSGSFSYYFLGEWTEDKLDLFSSGFFFAKSIPIFIAAPLTLGIFSFVSYSLFYRLERYLWTKRVFKDANYETTTHRVKTFASFTAFNIFYIFAGAPAYNNYPLVYAIFYFSVVAISAIMFYKEIFREEAYFIQERFALKIIKRWKSLKPIPSNLKEIYYTYINEQQSKKERLKIYRKSITELMQEGILNEGSVKVLEKLRAQIGITDRDHTIVMREIKLKNETLFDDSVEKSLEREYQLKSYKELVQNALQEHIEIQDPYLLSLQKQFCISEETHKSIMDTILNSSEKIHQDILNLLDEMRELIKLQNSIYEDGTREVSFLKYSLKNEFTYTSKDIFSLLFTIYKGNKSTLKILLDIAKGKDVNETFILNSESLSFMDKSISEKILQVYKDFKETTQVTHNNNKEILSTLLIHKTIQIAIAALLNTKLSPKEYLTDPILDRFYETNDIDIVKLLYKLKYSTNTITTYEKMMYLNTIPIFKNLKFNDLLLLALSAKVVHFSKDEYITRQGEVGKTLYVLIKGSAKVEIDKQKSTTLGHRDYFGEVALLGDTTRLSSVKVTTPITALTITKKEFKLFLENHPKVSFLVMKQIIKKLI